MLTETEARQNIVRIAKEFTASGLTLGSWGNISVRTGDTFAITPSGLGYDKLETEDVIVMGSQSKHLPSSEMLLHQAIYDKRQDVEAVIHTHSLYATVLAVEHCSLPVLTEDYAQLADGAKIRCAKYALAGSQELADNAVRALGEGFAVLLANHGAVTVGHSLDQALLFALLLEKAAHIYAVIRSSGGGFHKLSEDNIRLVQRFYFEHYAKRQEGKE